MNPILQAVRAFNHRCPWHQVKHSLAKRVDGLLPREPGRRPYAGVQGDLVMELDLSSYFEKWIYLNTYDVVTVALIRRLLSPGDTYVDAGANLGLFTLVASRAVGDTGRVFAFEPMPSTLQRLQRNLDLSRATNVTVLPVGCWDAPGEATLHEFADGHHGESSMATRADKTVGRSVTIQTVRIDDAVTGPVKLLKADIEGAEFAALRGATGLLGSATPPHLILELNGKTAEAFGYHPRDLVRWLLEQPARYRMHLLKSRRTVRVDEAALSRLFDDDPRKLRDVWFEPTR
jgi:FkbM family methyltransferase